MIAEQGAPAPAIPPLGRWAYTTREAAIAVVGLGCLAGIDILFSALLTHQFMTTLAALGVDLTRQGAAGATLDFMHTAQSIGTIVAVQTSLWAMRRIMAAWPDPRDEHALFDAYGAIGFLGVLCFIGAAISLGGGLLTMWGVW